LKKALYSLKQALHAWNTRIDRYFQKNKFEKCSYKHAMYIKKEVDGSTLFACLYVDDLIFIGNNPTMFKDLKKLWYKSLR
jgi:hypothetical protein